MGTCMGSSSSHAVDGIHPELPHKASRASIGRRLAAPHVILFTCIDCFHISLVAMT